MKSAYLFILILLMSCSVSGPNYNTDQVRRKREMLKEDKRMRKAMLKVRKKGSKHSSYRRTKTSRKYV